MKARVFKNWKTSALGVIILILGMVMVMTGRASWESFLLTVPIAAAFIYMKDPQRFSGSAPAWLILVMAALTGCSPQARINRLVSRHPELIQPDTIIKPLAVPIPEASAETCFVDIPGDTIRLVDGRLEIQYVKTRNTVYLRGRCKADTIRIQDTVIIPRVKVIQAPAGEGAITAAIRKRPAWAAGVMIAALAALAVLIRAITKRFRQ